MWIKISRLGRHANRLFSAIHPQWACYSQLRVINHKEKYYWWKYKNVWKRKKKDWESHKTAVAWPVLLLHVHYHLRLKCANRWCQLYPRICILGKESALFPIPTWGPAALGNRGHNHNSAQSHCKSPGNCCEVAAAVAIAQAQETGAWKRWAAKSNGTAVGCCCWSHCGSHYLGHPRHYQDLQKLWKKHSQSKHPSFI